MIKLSFSNAALKHVALATMLLDHIGFAFFPDMIVLRIIGRSSFVIFCFLLAEGTIHTCSRIRYFFRLLTFAFVSFIPYSLFTSNVCFCTWQLNVFFELAFSVIMITLFDNVNDVKFSVPLQLLILTVFVVIGILLHFDYIFVGFVLIASFYLFRFNKVLQCSVFLITTLFFIPLFYHYVNKQNWLISMAFGIFEFCGFVAFVFILNYDGNRGLQLPKWFYYSFYPLHLFIIWFTKTYVIC